MSKVQLIKSIVKKGLAEKPSFGTNPWDPWSTKANIAEDAALNTYLNSIGINPKHVTKDQKVAHSKMGQFLKWKRDHMMESLIEAIDKMDVVTFDIPLLIRVLEFTREDLKSDIALHKMVEKLINIRKKGVLTMKDYTFVTKLKEDIDSLKKMFWEIRNAWNKGAWTIGGIVAFLTVVQLVSGKGLIDLFK